MSPVPQRPEGVESFFDAPPLLEALAEAHVPGAPATVTVVAVDGHRYRLVVAGGRILGDVPFIDFHMPLGPATGDEPRVGYLGNAVRGRLDAGAARALAPAPGIGLAPFVDWRRFATWDAFVDHVRSHQGNTFSKARRRSRQLEAALGPVVSFVHHPAPELLELALQWKRGQYQRTDVPDYLAPRANAELFRNLWRRGDLLVSVLRAGVRPAALHLGVRWAGRFHSWVGSYDPDLARFGPGIRLTLDLLEASYRAGDRSFEFLYGDEAYKWLYATDAWVIGPVGRPPLGARMWAPVRQGLSSAVRVSPPIHSLARRTRRYLVEHGVL